MQSISGLLTIKPIQAELHREVKKSHVLHEEFCVVKLGENSMVTQNSKGEILKPTWSDIFQFERKAENVVRIEIWNRNPEGQAAMIGYTDIPVMFIKEFGTYSAWFDVISEIYQVGQIYLETEFLPDPEKIEEGIEEPKLVELDIKPQHSDKVPIEIDDADVVTKSAEPELGTKHFMQQIEAKKFNDRLEEKFFAEGIKEKAGKDKAFMRTSETIMSDPHDPQLLKKKIVQDEDSEDEESSKFHRVQNLMRDTGMKDTRKNSQTVLYPSWR